MSELAIVGLISIAFGGVGYFLGATVQAWLDHKIIMAAMRKAVMKDMRMRRK